ncbi:LacI family transcriptional regulator [Oceanicola sp. D3]|uniref:LacI family DNA-binding transcriptional regulator n=1 Tax=Oceanicola sp. D3 TaxID=2587163 RepID=UPI00111DA6F4|nr:LacI family DNA-binding transcriptional regulator [Oceanicola sp. D3]QDC10250.1 LacI family transcriptional regulator [Oceanicola sp. D3]
MARRPIISDVARAAGVSVATVDRVLNGRLKVREETARKVLQAAQEVGYHARNLIEQRLRVDLPEVRLGFILQKEKQAFYQRFAHQIEAAVAEADGIRGQLVMEFSASQSPDHVVEMMERMSGKVDALAATAVNHAKVSDAVARLAKAGTPVFSLLSDFAQGLRRNYVGSNNLKVGRMAAWMLSTAAPRPGKIALFVGGYRWHGHELRETGFRSFFREHAPERPLLDTLVNLETRQLTYEATLDLLHRHPDVTGIYLAGGGMEGTIEALREVRKPGEVALVVNELTPDSRAALADRYVTMALETPLEPLCRELVRLMSQAALSTQPAVPGQLFIDSVIHLPESV